MFPNLDPFVLPKWFRLDCFKFGQPLKIRLLDKMQLQCAHVGSGSEHRRFLWPRRNLVMSVIKGRFERVIIFGLIEYNLLLI